MYMSLHHKQTTVAVHFYFYWHPIEIANIAESSSKKCFTFTNEHQQHLFCIHTHTLTNPWLLGRWDHRLNNSGLCDPGVWVDMQLIIRIGWSLWPVSLAHKPLVETAYHRYWGSHFNAILPSWFVFNRVIIFQIFLFTLEEPHHFIQMLCFWVKPSSSHWEVPDLLSVV